MTKNILIMLIASIAMLGTLGAQAHDKDQDKYNHNSRPTPEMRAQHEAHKIASKLLLDDATTAKLVDTYKAYAAERNDIYNRYLGHQRQHHGKQMTDAEIEKSITNRFAMSRAIIDLREKYYKKFRTFLSPRQVQYIYSRERDNAGQMKWEKDRRKANDAARKAAKAQRKAHKAQQKANRKAQQAQQTQQANQQKPAP